MSGRRGNELALRIDAEGGQFLAGVAPTIRSRNADVRSVVEGALLACFATVCAEAG